MVSVLDPWPVQQSVNDTACVFAGLNHKCFRRWVYEQYKIRRSRRYWDTWKNFQPQINDQLLFLSKLLVPRQKWKTEEISSPFSSLHGEYYSLLAHNAAIWTSALLLIWQIAQNCTSYSSPANNTPPRKTGRCNSLVSLNDYKLYSCVVCKYGCMHALLYGCMQLISLTISWKPAVQVKMAVSCPSLQSPGVKYYKLESYSNNSLEPAGTFNEPRQSSEAELCANNVRRREIDSFFNTLNDNINFFHLNYCRK